MAARTGAGGGETPATVLDDNAGIVTTTAGPLAESSTSSSSTTTSSCSSSVTAVAGAAVPTVILTESTATSAGSLPLTGSQQQSNLHQVHQPQQPSRQRINLITDVAVNDVAAVRADRMRGGRNKFGPMYKRDRARKLQLMRQRQLAIQTIRGSLGDPASYSSAVAPLMHIKQEIQIPQVSSLTSSPDSSPSPATVAAGLVTTQAGGSGSGAGQHQLIAPSSQPNIGTSGGGGGGGGSGGGGGGGGGSHNHLHNLNPGLDSKLWAANSTTPGTKVFNFGEQSVQPHGGGMLNYAPNPPVALKTLSPIIREFMLTIDDREWQSSLFSLLQNQTYNQCEVDLFELMCKVLDQNLFSQVDWARNSTFFKDLKVDDQMKLLQHSWSDMLVLDHLHHRLHNNLPDETTLHNGQKFDLLCLGLLGVPSLAETFRELSKTLQELKFDIPEYICMKFLMLLNHDVRGLVNKKHVQEGHEQVQQALMEYTINNHPSVLDKFNKLLAVLPDIHEVATKGEEHLYQKHCNGGAPTQTLLMEMLHAKRK